MAQISKYFLSVLFLSATACSSQPQAQPAPAMKSEVQVSRVESKIEQPTPELKPEDPAPAMPKPETPKEQIWQVKKGKLIGPGKMPSPKIIGKVENKKGGGHTIDYCYDFGDFAVIESKSTKEVGSAEINIRRKGKDSLCKANFNGPVTNLKLREGSFAGIAGDIVVTEGADVGEGVVEAQLFSLEDGHEIYRVIHNPAEEFSIKKAGRVTGATFFAKATVHCELPTEGAACWQRIVEENKIPKSVKMPDCATVFKKMGKDIGEPAQVTARAKVSDVNKPKLEFINGSATCTPEP